MQISVPAIIFHWSEHEKGISPPFNLIRIELTNEQKAVQVMCWRLTLRETSPCVKEKKKVILTPFITASQLLNQILWTLISPV